MAALMIALFIGSWLPYALVATFGIVGLDQLVTPYSAELPVMLAKASAIWNPIVYALKHPRYRSILATYLPKSVMARCCRVAEGDAENSVTRRSFKSRYQARQRVVVQEMRDRVDVQIGQQVRAADAAENDGRGVYVDTYL